MTTKLGAFYGRRFLGIELLLCLITTSVFALFVERQDSFPAIARVLDGSRNNIYNALASVLGSLLGFTIAAVAIVIGYAQSPQLELLRESGVDRTLWRVFTSSIRALAFATAFALTALVIDTSDTAPSRFALYGMMCLILIATVRIGRVIWLFETVIKIVSSRPTEAENESLNAFS